MASNLLGQVKSGDAMAGGDIEDPKAWPNVKMLKWRFCERVDQ